MEIEIFKHIKTCQDIIYLHALDKYVDMDIENLNNQSDIEIKIKEEMFSKPIDVINKKNLEFFNKMKKAIKKRIKQLNNKS